MKYARMNLNLYRKFLPCKTFSYPKQQNKRTSQVIWKLFEKPPFLYQLEWGLSYVLLKYFPDHKPDAERQKSPLDLYIEFFRHSLNAISNRLRHALPDLLHFLLSFSFTAAGTNFQNSLSSGGLSLARSAASSSSSRA